MLFTVTQEFRLSLKVPPEVSFTNITTFNRASVFLASFIPIYKSIFSYTYDDPNAKNNHTEQSDSACWTEFDDFFGLCVPTPPLSSTLAHMPLTIEKSKLLHIFAMHVAEEKPEETSEMTALGVAYCVRTPPPPTSHSLDDKFCGIVYVMEDSRRQLVI